MPISGYVVPLEVQEHDCLMGERTDRVEYREISVSSRQVLVGIWYRNLGGRQGDRSSSFSMIS